MARRRKRSSRRRYARGRNPAVTLRHPIGAITAGFNRGRLTDAAAVAGGMFAQHYMKGIIGSRIPFAASGVGSYVVGIGSAGLMMFIPKVGSRMFAGALAYEVGRGIKEFVLPSVKMLSGMDDYVQEGMSDYIDDGESYEYPGLNDYFDTADLSNAALDAATMLNG